MRKRKKESRNEWQLVHSEIHYRCGWSESSGGIVNYPPSTVSLFSLSLSLSHSLSLSLLFSQGFPDSYQLTIPHQSGTSSYYLKGILKHHYNYSRSRERREREKKKGEEKKGEEREGRKRNLAPSSIREKREPEEIQLSFF